MKIARFIRNMPDYDYGCEDRSVILISELPIVQPANRGNGCSKLGS